MFDVAWTELLIVAVIALLVVGPKELPAMLRAFGRTVGKLRRVGDEFRREFEQSMRETGGDEFGREIDELRRINPMRRMQQDMNAALEAPDRPPVASPSPSIPSTDASPTGTIGAVRDEVPVADTAPVVVALEQPPAPLAATTPTGDHSAAGSAAEADAFATPSETRPGLRETRLDRAAGDALRAHDPAA